MLNPGRFFLVSLILFTGVCSLNAQVFSSRQSVGIGANMLVYKAHPGKPGIVSPYRPGISLMLGHRLGASQSAFDFRTQLMLSPNVAFPNWESPGGTQSYMVDMNYQIVFRVGDVFLGNKFPVKPYLFSGVGGSFVPGHPDAYVPLGGGLRFRLSDRMGIQLETVRKLSMNRDYQHLAHAIAFVYNIGGDNKAQAVPEGASEEEALALLPDDRDGDLIVDADDRCPDEPGLVTFMGCPQSPAAIPLPDSSYEVAAEPSQSPDEITLTDEGIADPGADIAAEESPEALLPQITDAPEANPETPSPAPGLVITDHAANEAPGETEVAPPLISSPAEAAAPAEVPAEPQKEPAVVLQRPEKPAPAQETQTAVQPESQPAEASAEKLPCVGSAPTVALAPIFFAHGDATLSEDAKAQLSQIAAMMNDCGQVRLILEGHTDDLGSENENLVLSIKRAFNVKYYLVYQHNVSQSRITSRGMGEKATQNSKPNLQDRAQNRRVDFQLAF